MDDKLNLGIPVGHREPESSDNPAACTWLVEIGLCPELGRFSQYTQLFSPFSLTMISLDFHLS